MRRQSFSSRRVLAGIGAALLIAAFFGAFLLAPKWGSRERAVAFDGIIERKATVVAHQSKYGSRSSYILFIRQKTGELVRFPVPWEVYERARVGMPARKKAGEQWLTLGASRSLRGSDPVDQRPGNIR